MHAIPGLSAKRLPLPQSQPSRWRAAPDGCTLPATHQSRIRCHQFRRTSKGIVRNIACVYPWHDGPWPLHGRWNFDLRQQAPRLSPLSYRLCSTPSGSKQRCGPALQQLPRERKSRSKQHWENRDRQPWHQLVGVRRGTACGRHLPSADALSVTTLGDDE
jgi:hypothetical protein